MIIIRYKIAFTLVVLKVYLLQFSSLYSQSKVIDGLSRVKKFPITAQQTQFTADT